VIQMCGYQADDFDGWNKFNVEKTVYIYDWCKVGGAPGGIAGPQRTPRYAGEQVQLFARNKVRGIYFCGGQELQGLEGPVYYVYGKMLGNPQLHYAELANDFYRAAYGKARAPMAAFFNVMHERLEMSSAICLSSNVSFRTEAEPGYTDMAITPEDWFCHYFPPKLVADMEKNLQRAKALAAKDGDPTVMKRIRRVEFEFNSLKNLADMFTLYRAYRARPNWATFDLLAAEVEKRNAFLDASFDAQGRFKAAFDGWPRLVWPSILPSRPLARLTLELRAQWSRHGRAPRAAVRRRRLDHLPGRAQFQEALGAELVRGHKRFLGRRYAHQGGPLQVGAGRPFAAGSRSRGADLGAGTGGLQP